MISISKSIKGHLTECDINENGVWVDLVNPTPGELMFVESNLNVHLDFLSAALDPEESSRIEVENGQVMVVVNASIQEGTEITQFTTIPVGIIILNNAIVTVALEEINSLNKYRRLGNQHIDTNKRAQLTLQIIYQITAMYLFNLKAIDVKTDEIEDALYNSMEDTLFIDLLKIEKTLVYFRNSLRSNKNVVDKLFRSSYLRFYEEDKDLLDDINIELLQAMEMADTSAAIIRSIRDGIASLMSNKLNITMRTLAAITIIMTIPTMIFSFYGMNVNLGNTQGDMYAIFIILGTGLITLITYIIMRSRKFFS